MTESPPKGPASYDHQCSGRFRYRNPCYTALVSPSLPQCFQDCVSGLSSFHGRVIFHGMDGLHFVYRHPRRDVDFFLAVINSAAANVCASICLNICFHLFWVYT